MQTHTEGKIVLPFKKPAVASKELDTFYNPVMQENRDISLQVIQHLAQKKGPLQIALPLAGSGIRAARVSKELPAKLIKQVYVNDASQEAIKTIKKVIKTNKAGRITVSHDDASTFLLKGKGFDYIDIDPFGSPVTFLDAALKRISRGGILAVTATDTAALCGTFPNACKRKYDAISMRCPAMHEFGLRILARKVQTIAAQNERAAIPVLSYAKLHYMRIYFVVNKGRALADKIINEQGFVDYDKTSTQISLNSTPQTNTYIGPLYTGELQDKKFIQAVNKEMDNQLLSDLITETKVQSIGFYSMPHLCKHLGTQIAPIKTYLKELKGVQSHIDKQGVKTNMPFKTIIQKMKKIR